MKSFGDYGTSAEMVSHICKQLATEFAGTFSPETVQRFVSESFDSLNNARVQAFVPLFIHRFARERLRAAGQAEGVIGKEVPEILFVCVHNAGRSQMAAALLDRAAEGRVHVRSAGSTPANEIHAGVREVMAEIGVDSGSRIPQAADGRSCTCGRCRHHDGLRGRVPGLPGEEVSRLGARGSGEQADGRGSPHP